MSNKFVIAPATGVATEIVPVRGRVVKSKWARNLLTFLMVFGPGLIVMVADNDAGAVSTYSQVGAQYGTHLLWVVLLLLPVLPVPINFAQSLDVGLRTCSRLRVIRGYIRWMMPPQHRHRTAASRGGWIQ